jgi:hypothetical protein
MNKGVANQLLQRQKWNVRTALLCLLAGEHDSGADVGPNHLVEVAHDLHDGSSESMCTQYVVGERVAVETHELEVGTRKMRFGLDAADKDPGRRGTSVRVREVEAATCCSTVRSFWAMTSAVTS